ncbi:MAG: MBL fold metallo-hydrolase [Bacteroidota bacterium]
MIRVKFWGTRGSIASPGKKTAYYGGNTSCVELRSGKHILVFDAGTGIRELGLYLEKKHASKPLVVHLFISHTHWDHIQGFPFFLPAYSSQNSITVYGPPGRDKPLTEILEAQMDSDYFPVELGDMKAKIRVKEISDTVTIGNIKVQPFFLNHPAMTLGYRVTVGNRVVIYATDNEPYRHTLHATRRKSSEVTDYPEYLDSKFVNFLTDADLLIGEAQYTAAEYKLKVGWGHTSIQDLVEFAWRANVKQLAIFHHDPTHDDKMVDGMIKQARNLIRHHGSRLKCFGARDGAEIVLR